MTKSCTAPPSGDADEDPDEPGQKAELRRQHRADERAGAGDGGEVVAEQHPAVGGHEVLAVGEAVRRGDARVVEDEDARGDECGVEAVADGERAQRHDHER